MKMPIEDALSQAGIGSFQKRLLGIFGLVWAADAMQVLAVGFTAASIAASFGLTLTQALNTGTFFFLGMLIGAAVFGRLADRYGRRRILFVTVACDAVFGLLSAFAPGFITLVILRFLTGIAVGGTLPVDYAMMAEFLPPKNRGRWLVFLEGFWAIGTIAVSIIAWSASFFGAEEVWRWIFAINALPAFIGFWLRFWVPESPMHLIKSGQNEKAAGVLNQMLKENKKEELAANVVLTLPKSQTKSGIFSPVYRRRTQLMLVIWFLVSISYYGIFTWLPPKLAHEGFGFLKGYGFLVAIALAQIPGYALAAYGVEVWGRRPTLILFLVLSAFGCAFFTFTENPAIIGASILLMSFALLGTWGALYAFTPEIFPTESRGTGMGAMGAAARFGGLLAPSALSFLVAHSFTGAIALFAALLLIAALAAFFINIETKSIALS